MSFLVSDAEIAALLAEPKSAPLDLQRLRRMRPKRGHKESEFELSGDDGNRFLLIQRQSLVNPLDFSVILGWRPPSRTGVFRLRRHNGRSHEHTNRLERNRFYDFHIHLATERYQDLGAAEDGYAEPTTRYSDLDGALRAMVEDAAVRLVDADQPRLF